MDTFAFEFEKDFILEDEIALLRPLQKNDYEHLITFALNEPELWKYSMVPANGAEAMLRYIESAAEARRTFKEYPFIIFDKRTQQYAGSTRFYDIQLTNKSLQLGYTWYGKSFQGTGLNKHCKFLMLSFAFEKMAMERVEFRADNENERSKAAMKSIGCTVEGVIRSSSFKVDVSRRDSILLSILKEEWVQNIKEKLRSKL